MSSSSREPSPTAVAGLASAEARERYLDELEDLLTGYSAADPPLPGSPFPVGAFEPSYRDEGLDWPSTALTMVGRRRLHNFRVLVERAIRGRDPRRRPRGGRLAGRGVDPGPGGARVPRRRRPTGHRRRLVRGAPAAERRVPGRRRRRIPHPSRARRVARGGAGQLRPVRPARRAGGLPEGLVPRHHAARRRRSAGRAPPRRRHVRVHHPPAGAPVRPGIAGRLGDRRRLPADAPVPTGGAETSSPIGGSIRRDTTSTTSGCTSARNEAGMGVLRAAGGGPRTPRTPPRRPRRPSGNP